MTALEGYTTPEIVSLWGWASRECPGRCDNLGISEINARGAHRPGKSRLEHSPGHDHLIVGCPGECA